MKPQTLTTLVPFYIFTYMYGYSGLQVSGSGGVQDSTNATHGGSHGVPDAVENRQKLNFCRFFNENLHMFGVRSEPPNLINKICLWVSFLVFNPITPIRYGIV